jgi:hypothetical protein
MILDLTGAGRRRPESAIDNRTWWPDGVLDTGGERRLPPHSGGGLAGGVIHAC